MLTVPAFVWQYGRAGRAVALGLAVGVALGALAWLDAGMPIAGAMVFVITGGCYAVWMDRRMTRHWPSAQRLGGDQRVAVARAARRGVGTGDAAFAHAVADYTSGLHAAAETARPYRWVAPFVLVVGIAMAAWDAVFGTWGNAVVSAVYLVMLLAELFWWPKRQQQLLDNADRAVERCRQGRGSGP